MLTRVSLLIAPQRVERVVSFVGTILELLFNKCLTAPTRSSFDLCMSKLLRLLVLCMNMVKNVTITERFRLTDTYK